MRLTLSGRVVIIMGSKSDLEHAQKIVTQLQALGIAYTLRVASAHKSVRHLLEILQHYNEAGESLVFIAIAGRSNALAGMLDANTPYPVITCPPVSSAFGGADIYSSLRMPSGVAALVILEPDAAALAAAKILALSDVDLRARIAAHQAEMTGTIIAADKSLN
jgi:5-(carboxyamino)imidazole ribonucleotide mutase